MLTTSWYKGYGVLLAVSLRALSRKQKGMYETDHSMNYDQPAPLVSTYELIVDHFVLDAKEGTFILRELLQNATQSTKSIVKELYDGQKQDLLGVQVGKQSTDQKELLTRLLGKAVDTLSSYTM